MIIKIGDEYLEFQGDIEMERQVMNVDNFENVGDFSYSFTVQPTAYNRKQLGIKSNDSKTKTYFSAPEPAELQTDDGLTLHRGTIIITNTIGIECSFISGNSVFFNTISGNINAVDFSEFDTMLSEANIVNSWTETSGVVFPITDRGGLSFRKDAFMKLRIVQGRVDYNDFQPFIYIKDVVKKALTMSGLKISGDLIEDATYNALITTNNNIDFYNDRFKANSVYVGKNVSQTITDAGFTKITFQDTSSVQYYNSLESPFDLSSYRWTVAFDSLVQIIAGFNTSDASKLINFVIYINGAPAYSLWLKGLYVEFKMVEDDGSNNVLYDHASPGDYYEVWAKVDASTPGSVSITSGTFTGEIKSTAMIFANALLPEQESKEFIRDIFKMFNVVCSFDEYTKTINTRFFRNISKAPEQDLSDYFVEELAENGIDIVSDYTKSNLLTYEQDDLPEVVKYNSENEIDYGNGSINIDNEFLEEKSTMYDVSFVAPYSLPYNFFGLQLLKLNFSEYFIPEGPVTDLTVTSIVDTGGLADFNSVLTEYNNFFKGDADGIIQTLQQDDISSSSQIIAINIPNLTLPVPIRFSEASGGGPPFDEFVLRNYNFTITSYNGDWEFSTYSGTSRTSASVAIFAKYLDGSPLDTAKQGLSFGPVEGKDTQTLIDSFYSEFITVLNNPVKPMLSMLIPENVYNNIDFLRPLRIKTEKFNSLFFLQKISGYKNSYTPCVFELIKL